MNPEKCHVMVLGVKTMREEFTILVDDTALYCGGPSDATRCHI